MSLDPFVLVFIQKKDKFLGLSAFDRFCHHRIITSAPPHRYLSSETCEHELHGLGVGSNCANLMNFVPGGLERSLFLFLY